MPSGAAEVASRRACSCSPSRKLAGHSKAFFCRLHDNACRFKISHDRLGEQVPEEEFRFFEGLAFAINQDILVVDRLHDLSRIKFLILFFGLPFGLPDFPF
jgi:hypothetical protein